MPQATTERGKCRFVVERARGGRAVLLVQLRDETIAVLRDAAVGFDLFGGIRAGQARQLADLLNKYVPDMFVTVTEKGATA